MSRRSAKKRMLIIVNPYATTVSNRLKNLVVYALQGRYEVETGATLSFPAGSTSTRPWSSGSMRIHA